jgi:hypothetical protein
MAVSVSQMSRLGYQKAQACVIHFQTQKTIKQTRPARSMENLLK